MTAVLLDIKYQRAVSLVLGGHEFEQMFNVFPLPTHAASLIGTEFLERRCDITSFECGRMF